MRNFEFMRKIIFIFAAFATILAGCNLNSSTTDETSDEARVSAFTFYEDTANAGLTEAVYKIVHSTDTGLIYNQDSLAYGTRLDSVVPYVVYQETPGAAYFILPDTLITSTGSDTMNLNQSPIFLRVVASDMVSERLYLIRLSVHQVDPELYVWKQLTEEIFSKQHCETKAFWQNGKLVLLVNNGLSTQVYESNDGSVWQKTANSVSELPTPCHVRDIVQHDDTLYYISNQKLYYSSNGTEWSNADYSGANYELVNMLLSYHGKAWAVVQDKANKQLSLATVDAKKVTLMQKMDGLMDGYLPAHFPVGDFAALEFESSSERPRAMIVGGRAINGEAVNSRWNIEYVDTEGYRLKDFTISQPNFESLTGASIIQYDNQLLMFGGIDNDLTWRSDMLYSDDEGMHWYVPDTAKNMLPDSYKTRQYQSVVVDPAHYIYIIGGESDSESFSDVYRGKRNLID